MSGCAGITKGRPRGGGICRWELEGLHALLDALVGWLGRTRRGATTNIPAGIPNPSGDVAALPTIGLSTRGLRGHHTVHAASTESRVSMLGRPVT